MLNVVRRRGLTQARAARDAHMPDDTHVSLSAADNGSVHVNTSEDRLPRLPHGRHVAQLAVANALTFLSLIMLNSSTCSDFTTTGLINLVYFTMQRP